MIGDDVEIKFLESTRSHVKIAIEAPKEILVLRKELWVTGKQNRTASGKKAEGVVGALLGLRAKDS